MENLNINIIKSPTDLKRTTYQLKEIKDDKKKFSVFFEEGKTEEEKMELAIQRLTNYDGFYQSPHPLDFEEKKKMSKEDKKKTVMVVIVGMIAIISILTVGFKYILGV